MAGRHVIHFSCGATSAVAAKLTISSESNVLILRAKIREEHHDNDRFASDCEKWFGHKITTCMDEKYGGSAQAVWIKHRFIKSRNGAKCSKVLKRDVLDQYSKPDDIHVYGFDISEIDRANDFREMVHPLQISTPLIDAGLSKSDCLSIIKRAGIELPEMYKLGFNNNNCIGCPKGGKGYWNHVRKHFPNFYESVARIQDEIGEGSYFWPDGNGGRISLRQLDPNAGRHDEPEIECSIMCGIIENQLEQAALK
jgi:hypothetical protein